MERQEFLDRVTAIGTCEDQAQRLELLTQLSEEASKDYDQLATLTATNTQLVQDNESLRKANMKLFLRVGGSDEPIEDTQSKEKEKTVTESYDDIYKKKGNYR